MKTEFWVVAKQAPANRIQEVRDILDGLIKARSQMHSEGITPYVTLPRWLEESFTPVRSVEEKAAWLRHWWAQDADGRKLLEQKLGWEQGQWLHWFLNESDVWELDSVQLVSADQLKVIVNHFDADSTFGAIEWLFAASDLLVERVIASA